MSEALVAALPAASLAVPWRDPHSVPAAELESYIRTLEQACIDHPTSAEVRTLLGIAHAVNFDVYKSMDVLEAAVALDPNSFWAQFKYAEIHYRLRILTRAEALTATALNLATNGWQLTLARKQLHEIRVLKRSSVRNLSWKMPVLAPALALSAAVIAVGVAMLWK